MAALTLLSTRALSRSFGGLKAVQDVALDLTQGEIHALIGPNGAGKTTLVSLLCGRLAPDAGTITFDGEDITRLPAHARVRRGIAYTFQITSIYPRLPVFDNVALAAQSRGHAHLDAATYAALAREIALTATLLLIEHNMDVVMDLAQRITVLDFGRILASGPPAEIRADPAVRAAYLGP